MALNRWLKRKPKNRRFERNHVLDVKMHSQHIRAERWRWAATALAGILSTAMAVIALWFGGQWVLDRFVYHNPAFSIRELDIQTDGILTRSQIQHWAGVSVGDNLLALDLARVERDLELQPVILRAVVVRLLPSTLKLRIVEREPIAQISGFRQQSPEGELKSTIFYLDEAGAVMSPLDLFEASLGADPLPIVTGVRGTELRAGRRIESAQMRAALRLVTVFWRSPMAGLVDLRTVDLSMPDILQVTTRQGSAIIFPLDAPERYLRRWRTVHDYAAQEGKLIGTLDLSVANNVPVQWKEAELVPPLPAHPVKPSRYKKKHV